MTDILGVSGVDIDIVSGAPMERQSERHEALQNQYSRAVHRSLAFQAELQQSPILDVVVEMYVTILNELAQKDERCQVLEQLVQQLGYNVELAPRLAEARMVRLMGGTLSRQYKERKNAAPSGIPA